MLLPAIHGYQMGKQFLELSRTQTFFNSMLHYLDRFRCASRFRIRYCARLAPTQQKNVATCIHDAGGCAPLDSLSSLYSRGTYPQTAFSYESGLTHIVHCVYCEMASLVGYIHTNGVLAYVTEETRKYLRGHKKLKRQYLLKSWANFRLGKNRQAYGENVTVAENQHIIHAVTQMNPSEQYST
jgi:hypothetical protein